MLSRDRRLGVAEALLDELQSDLQAIQSKLMCNDRGQWQVTPKCRCIFTIISQAGETFAGFVEGCKLRCDLRVLLCRFQRRDMQVHVDALRAFRRTVRTSLQRRTASPSQESCGTSQVPIPEAPSTIDLSFREGACSALDPSVLCPNPVHGFE